MGAFHLLSTCWGTKRTCSPGPRTPCPTRAEGTVPRPRDGNPDTLMPQREAWRCCRRRPVLPAALAGRGVRGLGGASSSPLGTTSPGTMWPWEDGLVVGAVATAADEGRGPGPPPQIPHPRAEGSGQTLVLIRLWAPLARGALLLIKAPPGPSSCPVSLQADQP